MAATRKPKKILLQFALALFIAIILGGGAVVVGLTLISTVSNRANVTQKEAQKKAEDLEAQLERFKKQAALNQRTGEQSWQMVQAQSDIQPGQPITPDMLTTVQSKNYPITGAIRLPAQALGKMVRLPVSRGQIITNGLLIDADVWLKVPDGMRAITIRIDGDGGVNGSLAPGAKVDVLTTIVAQTGTGKTIANTRTLLQNIPVIGVDSPAANLKPGAPQPTTPASKMLSVTLVVSPKQAEMLTLAGQVGVFQLTLRNLHDIETAKTTGLDTASLLDGRPPKPPAKPRPRPKPQPAPQVGPDVLPLPGTPGYGKSRFSMKIIRGSGSETVDFQR
jgi:pilus assembly protein CpaB